jgi:predicted transcriptional regulator
MAHKEFSDPESKGRRINGDERVALVKQLVAGYGEGQSIRALAASVDRSYGFVHRVLSESGVKLRKRGGRRTQAAA